MNDNVPATVGVAEKPATPGVAPTPRPTAPPLTFRQRLDRWDLKASPYLYVLPFFLVFAIIGFFPMVFSGYLSFFSWPRFSASPGKVVGFANYAHVLGDPVFLKALVNTIAIFLLSSVSQTIVATIIAALLDNNLRAKSWWRIGVILPFVVAPAATALIFGSLFSDQTGLINDILNGIGLSPVQWHANRPASWLAIATMVNWRWTGYNTLILLAAMVAVPRNLYEAASIDGAGKIRQFFSVTLPSIRPTMLFVIITSTIGGLHIFTEPRLFDTNLQHQGGADYQYQTLTMYVFNTANSATDPYPRAAAAAWLLFLIIVVFALANYLITRAVQRRSSI
ncbi:carbohydrate ABC transporter permease [Amycolatopsis taiwanensis]|uniref:carbohydrate ABC transporter permease n=1 Tax=Amycolatopsis taiwanensis TaxID=342230 RepID=UPI0004817028|nr:sugar ABC transporter permease [Amycolatopsis taiwanensis]